VRRRLVEVHDVEADADIRVLCVMVCASALRLLALFREPRDRRAPRSFSKTTACGSLNQRTWGAGVALDLSLTA
jgi:hypothetical protein